MVPDFFDVSYLQKGSVIQKRGHEAISRSQVLKILKAFDPVVVGTLPLDLFLDSSDIDIICFAPDLGAFAKTLDGNFTSFDQYSIRSTQLRGGTGVLVTFRFSDFLFEIVGQQVPVREQYAYRHLVAEWNLLEVHGPELRHRVIALKRQGIKTEPAFAHALNLIGDPYEVILTR